MKLITCYKCKIEFGLPDDFHRVAQQSAESFTWYCPNGHPQVFASKPTETDILRRERDSLKQAIAYEQDRVREAERRAELADRRVSAARGQITKIKKRAMAGICPCCGRHFTNLERHMGTKHPGFTSEPDATVSVN